MMEDKQIAEIIFVYRRRKRINQSELAKAANVSRNYISMIERGKIENVSLRVLINIFSALDLTIEIKEIK